MHRAIDHSIGYAGEVVVSEARLTVLKGTLFMLLNILSLQFKSVEQLLMVFLDLFFGRVFMTLLIDSVVLDRSSYSKSWHLCVTN